LLSEIPTLRSCIVAEQGYSFISLDASQIELRVAAILSQDQQMFADLATGDLHLATAIRMFGVTTVIHHEDGTDTIETASDEIMKQRRYDAKQCNFAVIYMAGEYQLASMFNCTEEEALQFMADHRAAYPRLYEWMDEQIALAKENGYVVNIFGRIRPLPELYAGSWKMREKAEKEVCNTLCQGTAIDIIKLAMLYMRKILNPMVRFVLNVHDEILLECPDSLLQQSLEQCQELEQAFPDYPFAVKIGKVYSDLKEME